MTDPDEVDGLKDQLREALAAWQGLSKMVHNDRCAHVGGIEECDPELTIAMRRAMIAGVVVF
jgi:hypothetical protein